MLRNAPGRRIAQGAALVASAITIGAVHAPLAAQNTRVADPPARPTSIATMARGALAPGTFSLEQILSYPFVVEMVSSRTQPRFAWVVVREGVRNIWGAAGPDFTPHQLTDYRADDGQELTNLSISDDGRFVVFTRGGDHDANWDAEGGLQPDPNHSPVQPKIQIWAVAFGSAASASAPKLLADGDAPVLSPRGDRVVFIKDNQLSVVPLDGSAPAKSLLFSRGTVSSPVWSPSGDRLAFMTNRGDHSFIGVFSSDSAPILYLAPSTSNDMAPAWSPDGRRIAFVRRPGNGGAPETLLDLHPDPWAIWTADASTGAGHLVWQSPNTLRGSFPGDTHLAFAAGNRLIFLSDMDGWPHLYSVAESGGPPALLTPGAFMAEYVSETPDRSAIVYNANTGTTKGDYDRRHLFRVPVDRATPVALTSGDGLEWNPAISGDGRTVAFIGAGAQRPPLPMIVPLAGGTPRALSPEIIPQSFPTAGLVIPKSVAFRAADGTEIHGQLFERAGNDARMQTGMQSATKKPGIIFVHGGPPRQMLLGWHYMDYYSNAYAVNQYLANHGYVVLAVNYRLGIGYGHDFNNPPHAGPWGASEYQDVQAGAAYLRALPEVEASKIGIWGGSYGGYLTALALARNSDVFKAGVDLHGVHNWIADFGSELTNQQLHYEKGDIKQALDVAWQSSPVASMATWKSPVLLIQGDDDRNVHFHETVDLARRLADHHVSFDELVFPDEIHGFLRHATWLTADRATADYFDRKFLGAAEATR